MTMTCQNRDMTNLDFSKESNYQVFESWINPFSRQVLFSFPSFLFSCQEVKKGSVNMKRGRIRNWSFHITQDALHYYYHNFWKLRCLNWADIYSAITHCLAELHKRGKVASVSGFPLPIDDRSHLPFFENVSGDPEKGISGELQFKYYSVLFMFYKRWCEFSQDPLFIPRPVPVSYFFK